MSDTTRPEARRGHGSNLQLSELDVVVPVVRGHAETTALGGDVEEHKHAFFHGDLLGNGLSPVGVLHEPVGKADEGDLVHLAEVLEAIGYAVEEAEGPSSACVARNGHFRLFSRGVSFGLSSGGVMVRGWEGWPGGGLYIPASNRVFPLT